MKKILYIKYCVAIFFLIFSLDIQAQNFQWANQANVTANTLGGLYRLKHDAINNYYICGNFTDTLQFDSLLLVAPATTTGAGYITKYNTNGHVIYSRKIDGGMVTPYDMAISSSGIVYVAGIYKDSLLLDNIFLQPDSAGIIEGFILKLDYSGKAIWGKRIRAFKTGAGVKSISLDASENIFLTGYFVDSVQINSQTISSVHINGVEVLVAKLDSSGSNLWLKKAIGRYTDTGEKIYTDNNGNSYIVGNFNDSIHFDAITIHNFSYGIFVAKYNSSGNAVWAKAFGSNGPAHEEGNDITSDPQGNLGITGTFVDTAFFGNDTLIAPPQGPVYYYDIFTAKLDTAGNVLWAKQGSSSGSDAAATISSDDSANFYITGLFHSMPLPNTITFDGITLTTPFGTGELYNVKYNSSGVIQWAFALGGQANNGVSTGGLLKDHNGDLVAAVRFGGNAYLQNIFLAEPSNNFRPVLTKGNELKNIITGKVFFDFNNDAIFNNNDFYFNQAIIESNGIPSSSCYNHSYYLTTDTGQNNVAVGNAIVNANVTPASYNIYFSGYGNIDSLNDFSIYFDTTLKDLAVNIFPHSALRPNQNFHVFIHYRNKGWSTVSVFVNLIYDPRFNFVSSTPAPSSQTGDTVTWNYFNLAPQESRTIKALLYAPAANLQLGDTTYNYVTVLPLIGDTLPVDNYDTLYRIVGTGWDPNTKEAFPAGDITTTQVQNGIYLDYNIRFQNTGNDTAFNVFIYDTLSTNLDWSTFELTASSYPCTFTFAPNGFIEFRFDGIRLPDSTTNEPGSHGLVAYRIQPLSTLTAGSVIENNAYIFFDAHLPVLTNTTQTEVVFPSGIKEHENENSFIKVYPNPAAKIITVKFLQAYSGNVFLIIRDVFGRAVWKNNYSSRKQININLSNFAKGVYFLQANSEQNSYRVKIIKE
jgi:uncharacterized repeat protein (TIGR01451 family)